MNAPTDDLFSQLTPEQLQALLQGGTLQDKGGLLAQQLEQLMGPTEHREYSTPLGAGLGGIAEAMDGTANAFHAKALRGQQQQNIDAQGKLVGDYAQLLRPPQAAPAGSEFSLPSFPERPMSAPPMVQANADVPKGGMMPGVDIGQFATPSPSTAAGDDLSTLPEVANAQLPDTAALIASLRGKKAAQSIHPGMPQSKLARLNDQTDPFGY
jgi:hypothetical protein